MSIRTFYRLWMLLLLSCCLLSACDLPSYSSYSGTTTATATTGTASTIADTPKLNTWKQVASGVETRYEDWKSPNNEDTVTVVRFDPHHIHLAIGYQPTQPLSMTNWMEQLQATAIINGGYFDTQHKATGLIVAHGQTTGSSYNGYGGMLFVDAQGTIGVRSLRDQPYSAGEDLTEATQSSPMLMIDGQRTQFQANATESRRTVVATDTRGNLLFIVSPGQAFSLDELADLLSTSDLALTNALNLDGGSSTGLYVKANQPANDVTIDSLAALPIVITVKAS